MNSLFKYINSKGFSLVETLLAVGIVGGITLTVAKLGQETTRLTKTSDRNTDMNNFINDVSYILSDKNNCKATVGEGSTIGSQISAIRKDVNGVIQEVYGLNKSIGNNSFTISQITTVPSANGADLIIEVNRGTLFVSSSKSISRRIPLKVDVVGNVIEGCYSDIEGMIESAVRAACKGNSARYDEVTKECHHDAQPISCSTGEILREIVTINGEMQFKCEPLFSHTSTLTCPQGQLLSSVSITGEPVCTPINTELTNQCPDGYYARNLINGNLQCIEIPKCGHNSFLRTNEDGELRCILINCNSSTQFFAGFDPSGNARCVNYPTSTCGPRQYISEITASGNVVCTEVPNHEDLPTVDFYFVDGFNSATKQWSRKSIPQVSQQLCSYFTGMTWNGSRCEPVVVPVNGGWSSWSGWSTCEGGTQKRQRSCSNPTPANGGDACSGSSEESQTCTSDVVNGGWSDWGSWSECFAAQRTRTRTCTNPTPANGGSNCTGDASETQTCGGTPVNGGWSDWGSWSACNGATNRTRTRTCTNPAPSSGGANCSGSATESEPCATYPRSRKVTSDSTFSLTRVVPGSMRVWLQGGGGGGGRGYNDNGGGGGAGELKLSRSLTASHTVHCSVAIGAGGCPGGDSGCSGSDNGAVGGTTVISCGLYTGATLSAAGGSRGMKNGSNSGCNGCGAGAPRHNVSTPRADNITNSGGHLSSRVIWINQGGAGGGYKEMGKSPPSSTYGGGGGGGTDNGHHTGGRGRQGIVYIEWLEY
jgi:type II secretory pathway pseudopilin PulG